MKDGREMRGAEHARKRRRDRSRWLDLMDEGSRQETKNRLTRLTSVAKPMTGRKS
jgi:hypothetical protein